MRPLVVFAWLVIGAPVFAQPKMTVLVPTADVMSTQSIEDAFRDTATLHVGLPDQPIGLIASRLYASDIALVVLDATYGPLPVNRKHILAARQARVPTIVVLIANVEGLYALVGPTEGAEFVALEEAEIRSVLEVYGVGGDTTPVYHDSAQAGRATATMAGNLRQLALDLGALHWERRQRDDLEPTRVAEGQVYLLGNAEADDHAITIAGSRRLEVWVGGQSTAAEVRVEGPAGPGDSVGFRYQTEHPLPARAGARMLLINDDHIVGIGIVTSRIK